MAFGHAKHVVINWLEWGRKDQEGGAGLILGRPPRKDETVAGAGSTLPSGVDSPVADGRPQGIPAPSSPRQRRRGNLDLELFALGG